MKINSNSWLFAYLAKYKLRVLFLIFISILGIVFAVLKPLPVKVVIDNVLIGKEFTGVYERVAAYLQVNDSIQAIWFSLGGLLIITIGSSLVGYFSSILTAKIGSQLLHDLSVDFYAKLQKLSLSFYSKQELGDLLQRFSGDAFVGYLLVAQITLPIATSILTFGAMFYVMAGIDLMLAFVAISVIPIMAFFLFIMMPKLRVTSKAQFKKQGELSGFVMQSLGSMKMIQAFAREQFMLDKLISKSHIYRDAYMRAMRNSELYNQIAIFITGLATILLVGFGAYKGLNGQITAGELYIFLGYLAALFGPINSLSKAFATSVTFSARGRRIAEILDSKEVVQEVESPKILGELQGRIELSDVYFKYQKTGNEILKGVDLKIDAGSTVAFIGPTGAGKTSIISLINRFYDPTAGAIKFDGHNIKELSLHELRENVALVLQEPFIFPMSVRDNVAFGNPEASEEDIIEACKVAEAHEFIMKLKEGYATNVAESGTSLSGGEKQRICLARALLKHAPILILDEPTSALDALTESRIFNNLINRTKGKTVILISHRLSTIRHAECIYTIDNGEVVEKGTHEELLKNNGLYYDLYSHQNIEVLKSNEE